MLLDKPSFDSLKEIMHAVLTGGIDVCLVRLVHRSREGRLYSSLTNRFIAFSLLNNSYERYGVIAS